MIRRLTGKGLDAEPFLQYLNWKYERIAVFLTVHQGEML